MLPLPDYLLSACILTCQSVTQQNGIISVHQIFDLSWVSALPVTVPVWVFVSLKAEPNHTDVHDVEIHLKTTDGKTVTLLTDPHTKFMGKETDIPGGAAYGFLVDLQVKSYGTCFFYVTVDGQEVAKAVFTLLPLAEN